MKLVCLLTLFPVECLCMYCNAIDVSCCLPVLTEVRHLYVSSLSSHSFAVLLFSVALIWVLSSKFAVFIADEGTEYPTDPTDHDDSGSAGMYVHATGLPTIRWYTEV